MEEIEYLEEYEDLVLPAINSAANVAAATANPTKSPVNVENDDGSSSSLDQDIFNCLFDDNSDDETDQQQQLQKGEDALKHKFCDDSKNIINNKCKQTTSEFGLINTISKAVTKPASKHNKVPREAPTLKPTAKKRPELSSTISEASTAKTKVATVRPTVQQKYPHSQPNIVKQQTRHLRTVSSVGSPSHVLPRKSLLGATTSFTLNSASSTLKSNNNPQIKTGLIKQRPATIVKPEKIITKDPVEDPLNLDDLSSPESVNYSVSDITGETYNSISDFDDDDDYEFTSHIDNLEDNSSNSQIIDISNDSSESLSHVDNLRGSTPSPVVSEDRELVITSAAIKQHSSPKLMANHEIIKSLLTKGEKPKLLKLINEHDKKDHPFKPHQELENAVGCSTVENPKKDVPIKEAIKKFDLTTAASDKAKALSLMEPKKNSLDSINDVDNNFVNDNIDAAETTKRYNDGLPNQEVGAEMEVGNDDVMEESFNSENEVIMETTQVVKPTEAAEREAGTSNDLCSKDGIESTQNASSEVLSEEISTKDVAKKVISSCPRGGGIIPNNMPSGFTGVGACGQPESVLENADLAKSRKHIHNLEKIRTFPSAECKTKCSTERYSKPFKNPTIANDKTNEKITNRTPREISIERSKESLNKHLTDVTRPVIKNPFVQRCTKNASSLECRSKVSRDSIRDRSRESSVETSSRDRSKGYDKTSFIMNKMSPSKHKCLSISADATKKEIPKNSTDVQEEKSANKKAESQVTKSSLITKQEKAKRNESKTGNTSAGSTSVTSGSTSKEMKHEETKDMKSVMAGNTPTKSCTAADSRHSSPKECRRDENKDNKDNQKLSASPKTSKDITDLVTPHCSKSSSVESSKIKKGTDMGLDKKAEALNKSMAKIFKTHSKKACESPKSISPKETHVGKDTDKESTTFSECKIPVQLCKDTSILLESPSRETKDLKEPKAVQKNKVVFEGKHRKDIEKTSNESPTTSSANNKSNSSTYTNKSNNEVKSIIGKTSGSTNIVIDEQKAKKEKTKENDNSNESKSQKLEGKDSFLASKMTKDLKKASDVNKLGLSDVKYTTDVSGNEEDDKDIEKTGHYKKTFEEKCHKVEEIILNKNKKHDDINAKNCTSIKQNPKNVVSGEKLIEPRKSEYCIESAGKDILQLQTSRKDKNVLISLEAKSNLTEKASSKITTTEKELDVGQKTEQIKQSSALESSICERAYADVLASKTDEQKVSQNSAHLPINKGKSDSKEKRDSNIAEKKESYKILHSGLENITSDSKGSDIERNKEYDGDNFENEIKQKSPAVKREIKFSSDSPANTIREFDLENTPKPCVVEKEIIPAKVDTCKKEEKPSTVSAIENQNTENKNVYSEKLSNTEKTKIVDDTEHKAGEDVINDSSLKKSDPIPKCPNVVKNDQKSESTNIVAITVSKSKEKNTENIQLDEIIVLNTQENEDSTLSISPSVSGRKTRSNKFDECYKTEENRPVIDKSNPLDTKIVKGMKDDESSATYKNVSEVQKTVDEKITKNVFQTDNLCKIDLTKINIQNVVGSQKNAMLRKRRTNVQDDDEISIESKIPDDSKLCKSSSSKTDDNTQKCVKKYKNATSKNKTSEDVPKQMEAFESKCKIAGLDELIDINNTDNAVRKTPQRNLRKTRHHVVSEEDPIDQIRSDNQNIASYDKEICPTKSTFVSIELNSKSSSLQVNVDKSDKTIPIKDNEIKEVAETNSADKKIMDSDCDRDEREKKATGEITEKPVVNYVKSQSVEIKNPKDKELPAMEISHRILGGLESKTAGDKLVECQSSTSYAIDVESEKNLKIPKSLKEKGVIKETADQESSTGASRTIETKQQKCEDERVDLPINKNLKITGMDKIAVAPKGETKLSPSSKCTSKIESDLTKEPIYNCAERARSLRKRGTESPFCEGAKETPFKTPTKMCENNIADITPIFEGSTKRRLRSPAAETETLSAKRPKTEIVGRAKLGDELPGTSKQMRVLSPRRTLQMQSTHIKEKEINPTAIVREPKKLVCEDKTEEAIPTDVKKIKHSPVLSFADWLRSNSRNETTRLENRSSENSSSTPQSGTDNLEKPARIVPEFRYEKTSTTVTIEESKNNEKEQNSPSRNQKSKPDSIESKGLNSKKTENIIPEDAKKRLVDSTKTLQRPKASQKRLRKIKPTALEQIDNNAKSVEHESKGENIDSRNHKIVPQNLDNKLQTEVGEEESGEGHGAKHQPPAVEGHMTNIKHNKNVSKTVRALSIKSRGRQPIACNKKVLESGAITKNKQKIIHASKQDKKPNKRTEIDILIESMSKEMKDAGITDLLNDNSNVKRQRSASRRSNPIESAHSSPIAMMLSETVAKDKTIRDIPKSSEIANISVSTEDICKKSPTRTLIAPGKCKKSVFTKEPNKYATTNESSMQMEMEKALIDEVEIRNMNTSLLEPLKNVPMKQHRCSNKSTLKTTFKNKTTCFKTPKPLATINRIQSAEDISHLYRDITHVSELNNLNKSAKLVSSLKCRSLKVKLNKTFVKKYLQNVKEPSDISNPFSMKDGPITTTRSHKQEPRPLPASSASNLLPIQNKADFHIYGPQEASPHEAKSFTKPVGEVTRVVNKQSGDGCTNTMTTPTQKTSTSNVSEGSSIDNVFVPTNNNANNSERNVETYAEIASEALVPVELKNEFLDENPISFSDSNLPDTPTLMARAHSITQAAASALPNSIMPTDIRLLTNDPMSTRAYVPSFGVTPTLVDANGTRMYTFLHPAKYSRNHGNVLLDYCCPNLNGPMPAIDPTRIHAQVQTPVIELPSCIVLTTKVVTRAELESNVTSIPSVIRKKADKLRSTLAFHQTSSSPNATSINLVQPMSQSPYLDLHQISKSSQVQNLQITRSTHPLVNPPQLSPAPHFSPSINALAKYLPSTTTITAKIRPPHPQSPLSLPLTLPRSIPNEQATTALSKGSSLLNETQENLLRSNFRRFDSIFKSLVHPFEKLNFTERHQIIECLVASGKFLPQDLERTIVLMEEYMKQMNTLQRTQITNGSNYSNISTASPNLITNLTSIRMPALKPAPNRSSTTFKAATTQQLEQVRKVQSTVQQHNTTVNTTTIKQRQVPIYDTERNIIGYQLQLVTPTSSMPAYTKSTMSTPSGGIMSPSQEASSSNQRKSLKRPAQDSPRIFYTAQPLQASTPKSNLTQMPYPTKAVNKNTQNIPKAQNGSMVTNMRSAGSASAGTETITTTTMATVKRITRSRAAGSKIIIVSKSNSNEETILPDVSHQTEIKHETDVDDFIG